jgi:hypothetical protein
LDHAPLLFAIAVVPAAEHLAQVDAPVPSIAPTAVDHSAVVALTTIGKREYTPGILEMTAIYQLYTRKIADNLLGIQKVWYMSGIH